jgi:hypothetical protein
MVSHRLDDLARFYRLLDSLEQRIGGRLRQDARFSASRRIGPRHRRGRRRNSRSQNWMTVQPCARSLPCAGAETTRLTIFSLQAKLS